MYRLPPHAYGAENNTPALLREQQQIVLAQVDNTAMINISDLVDDVNDIHPRNKRAIGERLASLAMDRNYGHFTQAYESPVVSSVEYEKGKIVIHFQGNFSKLQWEDSVIEGLVVTDARGDSLNVSPKIRGKRLIIPVKDEVGPFRVSYCFDESSIGTLRTEAGIPVFPFRVKVH